MKGKVSETIESVGLIFEGRTLGGQYTSSDTSDIINVRKNIVEIGIRIDW